MNREAERKRLVELKRQFVENFDCGDCQPENEKCRKCLSEKEAAHLLDNGIVVPPVKVGQTVYFVARNSEKPIGTIDELEIVMIGKTESGYYAKGKLGENTFDIIPHFEIDNYTFFTSREEALKALEGSGEK